MNEALARAGLTRVPLAVLDGPQRIAEAPAVVAAVQGVTAPPGKSVLVVPGPIESRLIVRDSTGKLYTLTITHEVKETRRGSVCGCYPGASGTPRPDFPGYALVESTDTYAGSKTIVARGWIDLAYEYPDAKGTACQVP